jgi:hypothetical protein
MRMSRPFIVSATVGALTALVLLMPMGFNVYLDKRVEGQDITIIERREFYSFGTLFVTDPLFGRTMLDIYTVTFGVVTSGLVAGAGYAAARVLLSQDRP